MQGLLSTGQIHHNWFPPLCATSVEYQGPRFKPAVNDDEWYFYGKVSESKQAKTKEEKTKHTQNQLKMQIKLSQKENHR